MNPTINNKKTVSLRAELQQIQTLYYVSLLNLEMCVYVAFRL